MDQLRIQVEALERRAGALTLTCQAMWELLSIQLGFAAKDLEARIKEIDFRDGRLDGKISQKPSIVSSYKEITCAKCLHRVNGHRGKCLYCGAPTIA